MAHMFFDGFDRKNDVTGLFDTLSGHWRALALAGLVAAAAALAGVFTLPVLDRDEARYAQATAQMLESGDFVRINFLDQERNKKPVGIYWLQAASVAALSSEEARAIWAYRLASVLGAVLAALGAALIAQSLLGARAGLAAGVLMGSTILLGAEGGIAKTDAMLAGLTTLACWTLIRLRLDYDRPGARTRRWSLAFWALLGLGVLIKGPVTPLTAGLGMAALVLWEARAQSRSGAASFVTALKASAGWLKPLAFWPGPVLALLIVLPWLVAVQIATDGAFLREALGEDMGPKLVSGAEGHWGPPGYHLLALPIAFFPAVFFLPAGLAAAARALKGATAQSSKDMGGDRTEDSAKAALAARVLVAFSLPLWLFFEIMPTKLPHYVLPAYPFMVCLCAWGVLETSRTRLLWFWTGGALLILGALGAAGALLALAIMFNGPVYVAGAGVFVMACLVMIVLVTALRRNGAGALAALVILGLVWHGAGRGGVAPGTDLSPAHEASRLIALHNLRPAQEPVISTYTEPSLVFTLGGSVVLAGIEELAETGAGLSSPRLVIIDHSRTGERDGVSSAPIEAYLQALEAAACRSGEARGYNYSRGRHVRLSLYLTGPCPENAS